MSSRAASNFCVFETSAYIKRFNGRIADNYIHFIFFLPFIRLCVSLLLLFKMLKIQVSCSFLPRLLYCELLFAPFMGDVLHTVRSITKIELHNMTFIICLGTLYAFPGAIKVTSEHLTTLLLEKGSFPASGLPS